jgi:hypothetical protein
MSQAFGEADNRNFFGVLGTATTDLDHNSAGVTGIFGTANDVQAWNDRVEAFGQFVGSAVSGIVPNLQGNEVDITSFGFLAGDDPIVHQHAGVYGQSDRQGVMGISVGTDPLATGVYGGNKTGGGVGVRGETVTGVGVQGRTFGPGLAGLFNGNVKVEGGMGVTSHLTVDGDVLLKNRDVAERFGALGECAPGTVMVIGDSSSLQPCARAYDKRAIGVVSGAGLLRPAITLGAFENENPTVPIAMLGTAFCLVDAEKAPIEAGDLLTSSDTRGHAMKALDHGQSFGAIIGKALGSLSQGRGLVPIVVALQ